MLDHGIGDHHAPTGRHGDGLQHFHGAEIAEDQGIFLAVEGAELVQQTGLQAHEIVFDTLPCTCPIRQGKFDLEDRFEGETERHFQCGAAAHPGGEGHGAAQFRIERTDLCAAFLQFQDQALEVVPPVTFHIGGQIVQIQRAILAVFMDGADRAIHGRHGNGSCPVNGGAEHKAFVVVGMVSQDFQSSGSDCTNGGESAETGFERFNIGVGHVSLSFCMFSYLSFFPPLVR